jgi:hypothetical protein
MDAVGSNVLARAAWEGLRMWRSIYLSLDPPKHIGVIVFRGGLPGVLILGFGWPWLSCRLLVLRLARGSDRRSGCGWAPGGCGRA